MMSEDLAKDGIAALAAAVDSGPVRDAASLYAVEPNLSGQLALARALCSALGDESRARALEAEGLGYDGTGLEVPGRRRVFGYASSFAVRAIGRLEPEEIFLANREKFSQVQLTIAQPIRELELALEQIGPLGVLALRVPASEVAGEAANTDADTEVFIYILPREIERIIHGARQIVLEALAACVSEAIVGPIPEIEAEPDQFSEDTNPSLADELDALER